MQEMQETWVRSLSQEDPLEEEMQPTPVILPRKSHGQRNLAGHSPQGHKIDMTKIKQQQHIKKAHLIRFGLIIHIDVASTN